MRKYTDEDFELFGIAERAKKNKSIFDVIKQITNQYNPEKAKKKLEEYEAARDVAADNETSSKKDYHGEHRKYYWL